jgi:hypothetical protein
VRVHRHQLSLLNAFLLVIGAKCIIYQMQHYRSIGTDWRGLNRSSEVGCYVTIFNRLYSQ